MYFKGKFKRSRAIIYFYQGTGKIIINKQTDKQYFRHNIDLLKKFKRSFYLLNKHKISSYNLNVIVCGGGLSSQANAMQFALAIFFSILYKKNRILLKKENLLTKQIFCKERKKYGRLKARKAKQFSKR